VLTRTFDGRGLTLSQSGPDGVTGFTYDVDGNLTQTVRPSGVVATTEFDLVGRATSIVHAGGTPEGFDGDASPASGTSGNAFGHCNEAPGHVNQEPTGCWTGDLSFVYDHPDRSRDRALRWPRTSPVGDRHTGKRLGTKPRPIQFDGTALIVDGDTRVTLGPDGRVLSEAFETVEGHGKNAHTITVSRDVLTDLLGSAVGIAEDGIVNADLTWFGDFGDTLSAPAWDTVTSFTGHVETAGLVEFATRTYDPASRVWVQEDAFTGTVTRASSLNRYAYVEGSPVSHTDVLGAFRAASAMAAQKLSAADHAAFMAELTALAVTPMCVAPDSPSNGVGGIGGVPPISGGCGESSIDWNGVAAGTAAQTGAGVLEHYQEVASGLFRKGTSIGSWMMRQLRGKPLLRHTLRVSGRFGSNVTLGATDGVFAVVAAADNYFFRYDDVERQSDRIQFTLERTIVTEGSGFAVGVVTDKAAVAACVATEGLACGPAILLSAAVQTGVSEGSGLLYDWLNEGRVAAASGDTARQRRFMLSDVFDWGW